MQSEESGSYIMDPDPIVRCSYCGICARRRTAVSSGIAVLHDTRMITMDVQLSE